MLKAYFEMQLFFHSPQIKTEIPFSKYKTNVSQEETTGVTAHPESLLHMPKLKGVSLSS